MLAPVRLRHQQRDILTDNFVGPVSEHKAGGGIETLDDA